MSPRVPTSVWIVCSCGGFFLGFHAVGHLGPSVRRVHQASEHLRTLAGGTAWIQGLSFFWTPSSHHSDAVPHGSQWRCTTLLHFPKVGYSTCRYRGILEPHGVFPHQGAARALQCHQHAAGSVSPLLGVRFFTGSSSTPLLGRHETTTSSAGGTFGRPGSPHRPTAHASDSTRPGHEDCKDAVRARASPSHWTGRAILPRPGQRSTNKTRVTREFLGWQSREVSPLMQTQATCVQVVQRKEKNGTSCKRACKGRGSDGDAFACACALPCQLGCGFLICGLVPVAVSNTDSGLFSPFLPHLELVVGARHQDGRESAVANFLPAETFLCQSSLEVEACGSLSSWSFLAEENHVRDLELERLHPALGPAGMSTRAPGPDSSAPVRLGTRARKAQDTALGLV